MERIVRIVEVRDTRRYQEQGDRWVPIPGSGNARECARCGREHEVHAEVELQGGQRAVVGTGCAGRESMEADKRMGNLDRAAKRLAALRRELAAQQEALGEWDAAWREVDALPLPPVEMIQDPTLGPAARMGDTEVSLRFSPGLEGERLETLTRHWRAKRMGERGFSGWRGRITDAIRSAEEQIDKVTKRMREALGAQEAA